MTYFQFTKADMREERERGRHYARIEVGDALAALAHDTSRKLDDENIDRQILAEDLVTRLVSLSKALGSDAAGLFDSLANFHGDNPIIPLEDEKSAEETQELPNVIEFGQFVGRVLRPAAPLPTVGTFSVITGDGKTERVRTPLVSESTLREAHNLMTFEGYPRHAFEGHGPDCEKVLHKVYDSEGSRKTCGEYVSHAIHDWRF